MSKDVYAKYFEKTKDFNRKSSITSDELIEKYGDNALFHLEHVRLIPSKERQGEWYYLCSLREEPDHNYFAGAMLKSILIEMLNDYSIEELNKMLHDEPCKFRMSKTKNYKNQNMVLITHE